MDVNRRALGLESPLQDDSAGVPARYPNGLLRVQAALTAGERVLARAQRLPGGEPVAQSLRREQRSGAALLAGGIAYRLFFWLVSFGLVVAATTSFWVRSDPGTLVEATKSFGLSGTAARSATAAVRDGSHARWYLLVAGAALLVYFGVGAVRALRVNAFIAWQVEPSRLRRPIRASATFTALFILGLAVTAFATWMRHHNVTLGFLATAVSALAFLVVALLAFALLPRAENTTWHALLPGAVLVAVGVTAFHLFTVYYLAERLEHTSKLYGSLGASTVVLLGLFLVARVIVSAMFLHATIHRRRATAGPSSGTGRPAAGSDEA